MYTITTVNPVTRELLSISSPSLRTAVRHYRDLRVLGRCSRLWFNGRQLMM